MFRAPCIAVLALSIIALGSGSARAISDPNVLCQKTVVKQLERYKKAHFTRFRTCLDKENAGDIPGPCLDATSAAKLGLTSSKVTANIVAKCTTGTLAANGYDTTDCHLGTPTAGIDGTCYNMTVASVSDFAECMKCWKAAEFARFEATLYASHAQELCGTALDDTSATCSNLGCTSPLPVQHDLGSTGENDCQRGIAKAGFNYLIKVEHQIEKCMLKGNTRGACLADPTLQLKLAAAEASKQHKIHDKCGNRDPVANPPFCCRTGAPMQACVAAATRDDCVATPGNFVQEGKTCGLSNTCENTNPGGEITWWEHCPLDTSPCPGPTPSTLNDLIDCVDRTADGIVTSHLCLQFPNGGACPTAAPTLTPTPTPTSTP